MVLDKIKNYQRILILGSPGAGKTTFGRKLAQSLKRPIFHLDDYYWLTNWQRIDEKVWHQTLENLCSQFCWIIDGNHFKTLEKRLEYTDLIILLDYSVWLCLWRFCKRSIARYLGIDKDLPKNIKEGQPLRLKITIQWHLIKLIIFFKLSTKHKMISLIQRHNIPLITFSDPKMEHSLLKT